jgi:hypothetical protein
MALFEAQNPTRYNIDSHYMKLTPVGLTFILLKSGESGPASRRPGGHLVFLWSSPGPVSGPVPGLVLRWSGPWSHKMQGPDRSGPNLSTDHEDEQEHSRI